MGDAADVEIGDEPEITSGLKQGQIDQGQNVVMADPGFGPPRADLPAPRPLRNVNGAVVNPNDPVQPQPQTSSGSGPRT